MIAFACLLMFTAALVAGLLPAFSTTGKTMLKALQTSARTGASSVARTALRKSLLTVEIGITVVLLVAAGLLLKSFLRLRSADVGCVYREHAHAAVQPAGEEIRHAGEGERIQRSLAGASESHARSSLRCIGKHSSGSRILG